MSDDRAHAIHRIDQGIAAMDEHIDGLIEGLAAGIALDGYAATAAGLITILQRRAREQPDAVAAQAAVAITRLARHHLDNPSHKEH